MILEESKLSDKDGKLVSLKEAMMGKGEYLCYDPIGHTFLHAGLGKVAEDVAAYPMYKVTTATRVFNMSANAKVLASHQNIEAPLTAEALSGKYTGQPSYVKVVVPKGRGKDKTWIMESEEVKSVELLKDPPRVPYELRDMLMRLIVADGVLIK